MTSEPDVVILKDRMNSDDFVLTLLREAHTMGIRVEDVFPDEFAARATLRMATGRSSVAPDVPTVVRWRGGRTLKDVVPGSTEEAFVDQEISSAVRALLRLTASRVIGRPQPVPLDIRLSGRPVLSSATTAPLVRAETFSSTVEPRTGTEIQDISSYHTAYGPALPEGCGPYRTRAGTRSDWFVRATVLVDVVWSSGELRARGRDLADDSRAVARELCAPFLAIVWTIPADYRLAPAIGRIDPVPTVQHMGGDLVPIARSLLEYALA